jgi:hypothetical protein
MQKSDVVSGKFTANEQAGLRSIFDRPVPLSSVGGQAPSEAAPAQGPAESEAEGEQACVQVAQPAASGEAEEAAAQLAASG